MSSTGPSIALVLMTLASAPAVAGAPVDDAELDETMIVARTVMPRIAYHALAPTANPERVTATTFPGRIFHGVVDSLVGHLAGDDELGERAAIAPTGPAPDVESGMLRPIAHGAGLQHAGGTASGGPGTASMGGSIVRATSGIGDTVTRAILGATGQGAGP